MAISVGEMLPEATFKIKTAEGLEDVTTEQLTSGKKIVLFALPGAYTPTCHAKHVPSFLENYDAIKAKGVDSIVCVSVNDPFVLGAWAENQGTKGKIEILSDGNATFTKSLGLEFDGSMVHLGTRSKRYAMIVEDGKVTWLAVEEAPPMMDVSGAEHVLAAL